MNISQSDSNSAYKCVQTHTASYIKSKWEALIDIIIWNKTSFWCQVFADLYWKGQLNLLDLIFY